jgi:hypothetical protein
MSKFDAAIVMLRENANRKRAYAECTNRTIESNARYADKQMAIAESCYSAIRVLEYAPKVADGLDNAERVGAEKDEPEGSRWIQMSDTLAKIIARGLRGEDKDE